MHVAIIDYGSGNLHSAAKAFERAAREQGSELAIKVTARPEDVADADRVVLPGVGAFADCKRGLEDVPGMIDALEKAVQQGGKPFFGICVGLQLMAERGLEHGVTPWPWLDQGRGAAPSRRQTPRSRSRIWAGTRFAWHVSMRCSKAFPPAREACMLISCTPIISCRRKETTLVASTDYGGPITAFVAKDNMAGTQFHPEKSQKFGLALIANFLKWKP